MFTELRVEGLYRSGEREKYEWRRLKRDVIMLLFENVIKKYGGKRILITGNTGFKGSWLTKILLNEGADVTGYSLKPPTGPNLFTIAGLESNPNLHQVYGDVRDLGLMKRTFENYKPEIVFHLAAQPIVRESYENPAYTYDINVMGTVNVLECVRCTPSVKSFLNVTTDKVYLNREWEWGYRENEELNGYDPYSNSKSCAELVTNCYKNSFFLDGRVAVSTARAGNVIGGGDFSKDRIIPDCVRAVEKKQDIVVRNPFSIRPYEHVLEPIAAYLMIAEAQYEDSSYAGSYNVGPDESDCLSTGELVELFCRKWNEATGDSIKWIRRYDGGPHEANFLKLDCSKLKTVFGWNPRWNLETAVEMVVEWTKSWLKGEDVTKCMDKQMKEFLGYAFKKQ